VNRDNPSSLGRRLVSEAIGTGLLLAAVVGSGIMAESLAGGNPALALLANTMATAAALVALILTFGPLSGAHFNPAVTGAEWVSGQLRPGDAAAYVAAQCVGGIVGVVLAHGMFAQPLLTLSQHVRTGPANADVIVFGHTHKPYFKEVDGVLFVNAGSVGKPKDGDRRAGYALLTLESDRPVRFIRVSYDVGRIAQAIRQTALPEEFAADVETGGAPAAPTGSGTS
jgi:diadenosine tetraphosphatase ApaH/serine/threonine PP2A family protein phosphatase